MALILGLALAVFAYSASAQDQEFRSGFDTAFVASCQKAMHERAVRDYSAQAGIAPDKVASEIRAKIKSISEPLIAICPCIRDKVKTTAEMKSSTEAQVSVEMPKLEQFPECIPTTEIVSSINLQLQRLLLSAPPIISSLRSNRMPFTIDFKVGGRLSVFASFDRPPSTLARLVFLAPGTGSACGVQQLCIDKEALEMTNASAVLSKHARVLGKEGGETLRRLITRFGETAQIITSSHNFTNFVPGQAAGQFSFSVAQIDGQPIERSRVKRLWLIIFNSPIPSNPRALEFDPALTSVLEIEFPDEPKK